jgi:alpha-tubulin suppressor-like RCC1 family protein
VLKEEDVKMIGCGRKHYIIVTKDNNLLVWGNVFKEGKTEHTEGFDLYYGDTLFADGKIEQLEVKYSIFGALVKN